MPNQRRGSCSCRDNTGHICMIENPRCSLEKSRHLREHPHVNTDALLPGPSETQLGRLLHEIRCMKQLEIEQLARISGIAADDIDALERGQHGADVATLRRIAVGLGVSLGTLFVLCEQGTLKPDVESSDGSPQPG